MRKIRITIFMVLAVLMLTSVASALPPWIYGHVTLPGFAGPSSFDIDVTQNGDTDLPNADNYVGWCSDANHDIKTPATLYFTVYSSLNPVPTPPVPPANWNKINYVLNNDHGANQYVIQAVIWHYDGDVDPAIPPGFEELYAVIVNDADKNGAAFDPECGQKYAVILFHEAGTFESVEQPQPTQATIIVLKKTCDGTSVPEFPSLAVPAGMMIGMVGLVYFVRGRKY